MNKEVFGIENFNLITDDQYYYVFRALNRDDQREISEGITSKNGNIKTVLTNKQRYSQNSKYADVSEISLKEVWDHTKSVNFYRGTNCISLSSNANVSIDYGSKYGQKYLMIRIPKNSEHQMYNAGKYMISELDRILDEQIRKLPKDSIIVKLIQEIENKSENREIRELIGERFNKFRTDKRYISNKSLRSKQSIMERFGKRQAFSKEQQLEYDKLMGKLTILELAGMLPKEILENISISSLTRTIGSEFSNREFFHYGEMKSDNFVPISKINLDMFALLQVAREQGIDEQRIKQIQTKLIEYTNQGFEITQKDGKLFYSNGDNEINLNLYNNSVLVHEEELKNISNLSIEELFKKTNGTISYSRAKNATEFVYNLSIAQRKTIELANVLKSILNDSELENTINEITQKSIAINDRIITRRNGKGMPVSESVNIDINRGERKQFSIDEQRKIYDKIKELTGGQLEKIISNKGIDLEQEIYENSLEHDDIDNSKTEEERINRYYAEAILDTLDISSIYKNAIRDKNLTNEERERLLIRLEKADCKRLVNAFTNAGISEDKVSGYIINILASDGYQGYTFEELSRLDNLDEIIDKNVNNTNLRGHVYPTVLEELRDIKDDDNNVIDTLIKLRDYQQETVDNVDKILVDEKRFAGVVLPTGAGKSFVAITEMLKNQNGNILYIAPQQEILNQIQRHILKNIARVEVLTSDEIDNLKKEQNKTNDRELKLPNGKILPGQASEYIKKIFPHLKMLCYQGLSSKNDKDLSGEQINERDNEEKELREILKNADANLIVFDELHRSGAKTWKKVVQQLITSNDRANILGITATPIRDTDHVDMMKELAEITNTYTEDELSTKQYLGYEMYLPDAIQRGLVVEPKIVSFDFMLRDTDEYKEILDMIKNEKDENKKKQLSKIKSQIDELIGGEADVKEHIKNNISKKENEEIGKIIKNTIKKKDGRYIVFLPQHTHDDGLTENEYFEMQEKKIREILAEIDMKPEISRLSSADSKSENHRAITDFENSKSEHLKIMLAINKLNEGVHVDGINGEIMYRKINDGSTILYLQQLGRVIYSLDPNSPVNDEDIPIVYDIYNNYLVQNLNRTINQVTPKSDLQKLQEIIKWIDKHGYEPDINSENTKEARKAITLKKIQNKYKKYIDGIDNPRLSKSDIYEIEQIMDLAYSIDLFNKEIGERIIPPGEKDLSEVQLFKVTATQKKFLEFYKKANKVVGNTERHKNRPKAKLNDVMNILEILNSNDIFIDNELIQYNDTIKSVIDKCPKEYRKILLEELSDYEEEYPLGKEYNFAKASFRDSKMWSYFKDSNVRKLYACGIFEDIDKKYLKQNISDSKKIEKISRKVLEDDFIVLKKSPFNGLNVKTGTIYDENGRKYGEEREYKKQLETLIKAIKIAYIKIHFNFSFVNENENEIPEGLIRDIVFSISGQRMPSGRIPRCYSLKDEILKAREYLDTIYEKLDFDTIVRLKQYGILPLKFNKKGIDTDTNLPKDEFGRSYGKYINDKKASEAKEKFDLNLRIIKEFDSLWENKISLVNESIEEISGITFKDIFDNVHKNVQTSNHYYFYYGDYPKNMILFMREYIEKYMPDIEKNKELLIEYKKLGILPLKIDKNGRDIETKLPREEFGKSIKQTLEEIEATNTTATFNRFFRVLEQCDSLWGSDFSLANEYINELPKINLYRIISMIYDEETEKYHYLKGYKPVEMISFMREYIEKYDHDIEKNKEVLIKYKNLGILPLNINGKGIDIETGLPRGYFKPNIMELYRKKEKIKREEEKRKKEEREKERREKIKKEEEKRKEEAKKIREEQEIKEEAIRKRKEGRKKLYEERKRSFISTGKFNTNNEFIYKGKTYMYNPFTGKKADGTYAVEARDERGFNPDRTYKDTGEEYDEKGIDKYGFNKEGYYYKKQENGEFINTGLKYSPNGFKVDIIDGKRVFNHVINKNFVDLRGFTIDGICKWNNDEKYDRRGFRQDGTYMDTGEKYHNGYNAYEVDREGKDKHGKMPREIAFAIDYIQNGIQKGKANEIMAKYKITPISLKYFLYKATEMYPPVKKQLCNLIASYQVMIKRKERQLGQLIKEKSKNKALIEKLKKENQILRNRINLLDSMQDLEK